MGVILPTQRQIHPDSPLTPAKPNPQASKKPSNLFSPCFKVLYSFLQNPFKKTLIIEKSSQIKEKQSKQPEFPITSKPKILFRLKPNHPFLQTQLFQQYPNTSPLTQKFPYNRSKIPLFQAKKPPKSRSNPFTTRPFREQNPAFRNQVTGLYQNGRIAGSTTGKSQ